MRRIGTWTAAAVLSAGLLTGCGGSDTEAYCDSLEDAEASLAGSLDPDGFDQALEQVDQIVDDAPDEVKGDWEELQGALEEFKDAIEDAGLSVEDLADPAVLESLDPEDATRLNEISESMSTDHEDASDNIEKHAKDECDIDLSAS